MIDKERGELPFIEELVRFANAKVCVEIGVAFGDSLAYICRGCDSAGGTVYGFDLWDRWGEKGEGKVYGDEQMVVEKLQSQGLKNFRLTKIDTRKQREQFIAALKRFCPRGIDFAFIDGGHSYEGVRNDFTAVYPLMKNTGIIVFHDTLVIDGCREFILDLRTKFNDGSFDIIDFPLGHASLKCGVSILAKKAYPVTRDAIKQVAGSISTPREIEEREVVMLEQEKERGKGAMKNIDSKQGMLLDNIGFFKQRKKFDD